MSRTTEKTAFLLVCALLIAAPAAFIIVPGCFASVQSICNLDILIRVYFIFWNVGGVLILLIISFFRYSIKLWFALFAVVVPWSFFVLSWNYEWY